MHTEYAIIDQAGQFFGLPAKTFTDREAADTVMGGLAETLERLAQRATAAKEKLSQTSGSVSERENAEHDIRLWENERKRQWRIVKRKVGPWTTI